MKKIFYGFLALAGLAMVSCSQEIDEQINANTDSVKKIFTANTEDGASTRTSIALEEETGNYVVIWNGDEKIAVNGVDYKVIDGAGSKSVTFGADAEEAADAEVYNAVYPNNAWVEGGLNLEHLKEQTALNATYGHGYAVTVATTTDKEMDFKFKNALSFLRVRFSLADDAKEDAITIKTVKITADDNLWGTVSDVDYATGEIGAVANDSELGKSIVYTAGEDVVLDRTDNAIFDAVIAVPVNEAGRTLTIEITGENAWTGTPYTYKAEGVTKKYLRNNVTTLAKAIKPVEIEFVTEGVYKKADNAYYVTTPEGFLYAGEQMTAGKWNGATIDLVSDAEYDFAGMDFTPINANGITLNGNNATFKNITIKNSTLPYDAIFNIFYGNIYNLKVVDFNADEADNNRAGVIGGYFTEGVIENVDVDGAVIRGFQKVAGLLSYIACDRGNVTVKNCDVKNVTINAVNDGLYQAGGLVGYITNARYTLKFEENTVDALTINNATGWAEGETDADFVQFYSHAFVGSISQKPTTEADAATSFVIFTDNTIGTVTANPALSVSPRGNEFFGDRRANGFSYQKNTYLGTIIVNGVTLPNRINVGLDNLQAAIDAAENGATVTLAEDLTLGDDEALVIPAGKELTLDLGENTISAVSTEAATSALIKNDGTLNIVGAGTITYQSEAPSATNAYASNAISNYGTLVVGGDVVIENTTVGGACYAIDNYAGATCTIKDNATVKAAKTTVRIFNWSDTNTTLNVEGGTIISEDGYAINTNTGAAPNYTLNISGGTITTNDTDYNLAVYMYASGVEDGTDYRFNVTGGTFNGWFAINGNSAALLKEGNAMISGGTFNVGVYAYDTPAVKFVKGGKFVADPTDYVVDGYQATLNGEYYEVGEYVPAASIGGTEYETIEEAIAAAKEIGGEVTVNVVAGTYDSFPADKLTEGVTLECAEGTVFEGSSSLNIGGATVKGATFSNDGGNAVGGTVNGDFEDCVFTGTNGHRYCYLPEDGEITYTNCVFEGSTYGVHFDGGGEDSKLIFRDCEFYGFNALPGTIDVEFYGCFFGHKEGGSGYNGINLWGNTYMEDTKFDWTADGVTEFCDPVQATPTYVFNNVTVNKTGAYEPIQFSDMAQPEGVVVTIDGVVYANVATDEQLAAAIAMDVENLNIYLVPGTYNFGGLSIAPATVTIKGTDKAGVVINMNESIYLSGKTVNFENLTYTAPADLAYTEQAYAFVHHAAGFNFDNCVINRLRLNVASATIQNSTFEVITNSGFDGYGLYYYGNDKSNVKVENCVFNTTGKAICVYSESAKEYNLTVNDTQFYSSNTSTDKAAVSIHAEYGIYGTLTMNRCEATGFIANNNGLWRELNNNTKVDTYNFTKIIDGVKVAAVLRINNLNGWDTLNVTIKSGETTLVDAQPMTKEGDTNIYSYELDAKYIGTEVDYYITYDWYQTSTKTVTLKATEDSEPITLNTTYLEPGTWDWTSATFGAWFFGGNGEADTMVTAVKVKDNFFEVEIPGKTYKNVIFVRCNKSNPTASWDTKWNQTGNLTLNHKCYCVNTWDNGGDSQWY